MIQAVHFMLDVVMNTEDCCFENCRKLLLSPVKFPAEIRETQIRCQSPECNQRALEKYIIEI